MNWVPLTATRLLSCILFVQPFQSLLRFWLVCACFICIRIKSTETRVVSTDYWLRQSFHFQLNLISTKCEPNEYGKAKKMLLLLNVLELFILIVVGSIWFVSYRITIQRYGDTHTHTHDIFNYSISGYWVDCSPNMLFSVTISSGITDMCTCHNDTTAHKTPLKPHKKLRLPQTPLPNSFWRCFFFTNVVAFDAGLFLPFSIYAPFAFVPSLNAVFILFYDPCDSICNVRRRCNFYSALLVSVCICMLDDKSTENFYYRQ